MKNRRSLVLRRLVLGLALALALGVVVQGFRADRRTLDSTSSIEDRSSRNSLPKAEALWARPLDQPTAEGNALLTARFEQAGPASNRYNINLDGREIALRDDGLGGDQAAGDGVFSAVIDFDFEELSSNRDRIRALQQKLGRAPQIPVFKGRERIIEQDFARLAAAERAADGSASLMPLGSSDAVDPARSLIITDLKVVEDPTRTFNPCTLEGTPMGKWTFGHLVTEIANQSATGVKPVKLIKRWLKKWTKDQTINGLVVPKRANIKSVVLDNWPRLASGALDLSRAPFKLLAIVNRVDLRTDVLAGGNNAGEGRFVFGLMGPLCEPQQFTIILEYGIKRNGCAEVKAWAKEWFDLSALELGSPEYNAALENITEQFVKAGADPSKPNASALNRIRTNEIRLGPLWELREFKLSEQGQFEQVVVAQTPRDALNRSQLLANYINENEAELVAQLDVLPLAFQGQSFLGGSSIVGDSVWNSTVGSGIANRQARHIFSLQTCNGCHQGETETAFQHVFPAFFKTEAVLSRFLTGFDMADPADGAPTRHFGDLERRALDLDELVNSPCLSQLGRKDLNAAH
ncbi:MAG TPA: choice-of-anchor X domain-containing protein [Blastocatellia bacterium]|nr:choice-of-anchor X domain-containing protein [Blastocatellia bacterium]